MSFALGDVIIDRIQYAWAENFEGTLPLYVLTQLSEASIELSAESKDAVDKDGTLVKRFWQGKTGTFTATNAMLSMPVVASMSGVTPDIVSDGQINGKAGTLTMPKIVTVESGKEITLTGAVEGTIHVAELTTSGAMGAVMEAGASSTATSYVFVNDTKKLTAPTNPGKQYIVKYNRTVSNGAIIHNQADKFPQTVRLYLKCLAVDPCSADTLKALYVELPSFQPSPETTINFTTDGTLDYSGDLQVDYCSVNKSLFNLYWCDDDEE